MSGPPRKPTRLKIVAGTFRPDRSAKPEPMALSGIGDPPEFLDDAQRVIWRELVEESPAGLLTAVDRGIVARYCVVLDAYAMAVKAWNADKERLVNTRELRITEAPLWKALRRDLDGLRAMEGELGYTPAARSRLDFADDGKPKGALAKFTT